MDAGDRYILMLENDPDDRYFTESTLQELGMYIPIRYASYDGELVEQLSISTAPVLIILASNTYPETGIGLLRTIRSQPTLAHVPVVILVEDASQPYVREYYSAGAN